MNFIISVLKDFYECCNMPVKAISSEFDDIYKIGYNDYFEEIFPLEQIKDLIKKAKVITIASSPFFIEQDYAIKVLKELFNYDII